MKFYAIVNCMDGRVQLPVIEYVQKRFGALFVDSITEPGPNAILATGKKDQRTAAIHARLKISVEKHGAGGIAVVGHHDCTGNPVDRDLQQEQTAAAVGRVKEWFPSTEVIGLWVDAQWQVQEISLPKGAN